MPTTAAPATPAPALLSRTIDASGDLTLAALFMVTWLSPGAAIALPLSVALLTVLLEFIVVHSTGFMGSVALAQGSRTGRAQMILGFGAMYTLFVVGFGLAFEAWWPLITFWTLTLNRSLGVLFDRAPSDEQALHMRKGWAAVTLSYLFAVMVTALLPMPGLGIDRAVVAAAELPSSGLWVERPHRVVAAGTLHFTLAGLSALFGHPWISDRSVQG